MILEGKCGWNYEYPTISQYMAVCQNLVPLVNIKIAGKWMFIPLKKVLIGIDPYPYPNFGSVPINFQTLNPTSAAFFALPHSAMRQGARKWHKAKPVPTTVQWG